MVPIWTLPPMPSTLVSIVSRSTFSATTLACSRVSLGGSMYRIVLTAKLAISVPSAMPPNAQPSTHSAAPALSRCSATGRRTWRGHHARRNSTWSLRPSIPGSCAALARALEAETSAQADRHSAPGREIAGDEGRTPARHLERRPPPRATPGGARTPFERIARVASRVHPASAGCQSRGRRPPDSGARRSASPRDRVVKQLCEIPRRRRTRGARCRHARAAPRNRPSIRTA